MVILYNYHLNRIRKLQSRHPYMRLSEVKRHYFSCLNGCISEVIRGVGSSGLEPRFIGPYVDAVVKNAERSFPRKFYAALLHWHDS